MKSIFVSIVILLFTSIGYAGDTAKAVDAEKAIKELLAYEYRPSTRDILKAFKGRLPETNIFLKKLAEIDGRYAGYLEDSGDSNNAFRKYSDLIKIYAPKVLALLEIAYPGASYFQMGRDGALFGDFLEIYYDQYGHHDRVYRLFASGPTVRGLDEKTGPQFLISNGLLKRKGYPILFVDNTGWSGQSQSQILTRMAHDILLREGLKVEEIQQLLTTASVSKGWSIKRTTTEEEIASLKAQNHLMSPIYMNQSLYDAFYRGGFWHDSMTSELVTLLDGRLAGKISGPYSEEYKLVALAYVYEVFRFARSDEFNKSVADAFASLGRDYDPKLAYGPNYKVPEIDFESHLRKDLNENRLEYEKIISTQIEKAARSLFSSLDKKLLEVIIKLNLNKKFFDQFLKKAFDKALANKEHRIDAHSLEADASNLIGNREQLTAFKFLISGLLRAKNVSEQKTREIDGYGQTSNYGEVIYSQIMGLRWEYSHALGLIEHLIQIHNDNAKIKKSDLLLLVSGVLRQVYNRASLKEYFSQHPRVVSFLFENSSEILKNFGDMSTYGGLSLKQFFNDLVVDGVLPPLNLPKANSQSEIIQAQIKKYKKVYESKALKHILLNMNVDHNVFAGAPRDKYSADEMLQMTYSVYKKLVAAGLYTELESLALARGDIAISGELIVLAIDSIFIKMYQIEAREGIAAAYFFTGLQKANEFESQKDRHDYVESAVSKSISLARRSTHDIETILLRFDILIVLAKLKHQGVVSSADIEVALDMLFKDIYFDVSIERAGAVLEMAVQDTSDFESSGERHLSNLFKGLLKNKNILNFLKQNKALFKRKAEFYLSGNGRHGYQHLQLYSLVYNSGLLDVDSMPDKTCDQIIKKAI